VRNIYNISVEKHEGKGSRARQSPRWKENIKMALAEGRVQWLHLVNTALHLPVP